MQGQISFFDGANPFVIDRPVRLIELFAGIGAQAKAVERLGASVRLDMHAVARVEHPAADAMRHGLAIYKRPHANALHNARYMNMHMPHATPLIKTDQKGTGLFW